MIKAKIKNAVHRARVKADQICTAHNIRSAFDQRPVGFSARDIRPVYFLGTEIYSSFKLGGTCPHVALKKIGVRSHARCPVPLETIHDAILVFVKHGIPANIRQLKANGNKIIVDMRDNFIEDDGALDPDFIGRDTADYLLFPNQALLDKFLEIKPTASKCAVLYGFCDPAITAFFKKQNLIDRPALRCCYFGFKFNLDLKRILDREQGLPQIDLIAITDDTFRRCMLELRHYNMHLDYRPLDRDSLYKPLTKILIAAQCRANIMIQRSARVLELLPADYPYLIDEEDPAGALRRARDTFGTPQWTRALAVMDRIREDYSFSRHMQTFVGILKELS